MHGPHVQRHIHDGAIEPVAAVENLPMGNRGLFRLEWLCDKEFFRKNKVWVMGLYFRGCAACKPNLPPTLPHSEINKGKVPK
jgi:hypothetical protein